MEKRKYTSEDELCFILKDLYSASGYRQFKMSKFEEYSVYLENRNFLQSRSAITFTDHNGRLLALKPDVTLSIVKNTKADGVNGEKLYYRESVYRADKVTKEFREICQMGLEYIGDIDAYGTLEVLSLAAKSLNAIDGNYVLDLSHSDIIAGLVARYGAESYAEQIYSCVSSKNVHDLKKLCKDNGLDRELAESLSALTEARGGFAEVLAVAERIDAGGGFSAAIAELKGIYSAFEQIGAADKLRLDFSIVNDSDYYTGVTFKGYVKRCACAVLSGGSYDKLARKYADGVNAMGFAVYVNELSPYFSQADGYAGDVFVRYKGGTSAASVLKAVDGLAKQGMRVSAGRQLPKGAQYKKVMDLEN